MPLEYLASVVNLRTIGIQAGAGADVLQNGQVANRADDLPPLMRVGGVAGPLEDRAPVVRLGTVRVQAGAVTLVFELEAESVDGPRGDGNVVRPGPAAIGGPRRPVAALSLYVERRGRVALHLEGARVGDLVMVIAVKLPRPP